jgi:chromosome partitioning protein
MIVALLNQKGGVGKTTLATHVAGELAMRGQHVVLLDADPQGSSLDWTQRRSQQGLPRLFSAVGLARETLHQEAPELARRADHVIIDGPPRIAALARSALLAAERVLIPVQPSPYDLWASAEMVALIREAQVFRPALRAAFVINRRVSTTVIGREARQALADQPLPALRAEVHQRIVFADSVAAGRLARETASGESPSQSESDEEDIYEQAYGVEDPASASLIEETRERGDWSLSRKTRQRIGTVFAVGLFAALVLAMFRVILYPYDEYRPDAETALSRAIDGTARIGAMRVSFMPSPIVILEKVSLGDTPHVTIDVVRMVADPVSLLGGERKFREVRLEGVRVSDMGLAELSRWLSRAALAEWGVRSVFVEGLSLSVGGVAIGHLAGSADVGQDRGLEKLVLRSKDGNLTLQVTPTENGVSLVVSAKQWQLPFPPPFALSAFDARASLSPGTLRIEQFDGTAFNGLYKGSGVISWGNSARAEIAMNVQNIDAKGLLEAWGAPATVDSAMTGRLTVAASAPTPDRLAEHVRLNGVLKASRGSLQGIDLSEALRTTNMRSGGSLRGGRTDFEEFSATIALDERVVRVSSARLDSGRLKATGHADVLRQTGAIAGSAVVGLHASSGQRYSTVTLSGTAASPELRAH